MTAEQVDFMHQVSDAFDSDDIVGSTQRATSAGFVDDLTRDRIGEGVKVDKIHVNLGGEEYGSTFTASDRSATVAERPVFFNPIAQAKRVQRVMRFLVESDVDPALLERALADVPEDLATYVRGVRAGEPRVPELESKYSAIMYARNLLYNMGHEKVGHWVAELGMVTPSTSVQNTSCGSGCTVNQTLPSGISYCRHRWQSAADAVLATSAVQAIAVN